MTTKDKELIENFIKQLEVPYDINAGDCYEIEEYCSNNLTDQFPEFHYGASKIVFVSPDCNYVIKIPMFGYIGFTEDEEPIFIDFEGADGDNDYCLAEVNIYNNAKENGFRLFFAEEQLFGYIGYNKYPIYIQEKADYPPPKRANKETITIIENDDDSKYRITYSKDWNAEAIYWYGEDTVADFVKYYERYNQNVLEDLHGDNIGYTKYGRPVLIDYSGFSDEMESY